MDKISQKYVQFFLLYTLEFPVKQKSKDIIVLGRFALQQISYKEVMWGIWYWENLLSNFLSL